MAYHFPFLLLGHTLEEVLSRTNEVPEGRGWIFQQKPDVILTGAAEEDRLGKGDPVLIDGHAFAYYFQVNLPCVANDLHEFECDVKSDGNVHVKGVIDNDSREIRLMSSPLTGTKRHRRISPPTPFTISFRLPDHVNSPHCCKGSIRTDGLFSCYVLRAGLPPVCNIYFEQSLLFPR